MPILVTTPQTRALPIKKALFEGDCPAVWPSGNMFKRSNSTGSSRLQKKNSRMKATLLLLISKNNKNKMSRLRETIRMVTKTNKPENKTSLRHRKRRQPGHRKMNNRKILPAAGCKRKAKSLNMMKRFRLALNSTGKFPKIPAVYSEPLFIRNISVTVIMKNRCLK